jgi:hypothetical protein
VLAFLIAQINAVPTDCFSEITNEVNLVTHLGQGDFQQVAQDTCKHFEGSAIEALAGPIGEAAAIALCYDLLLVAEAELAGVAIANGSAQVLIPLSEFAPELALAALIVDSAICAVLVPCVINMALDESTPFCKPSSMTSTTTTSTTNSKTSSPLAPSAVPGPTPGLDIPFVASDQCASCQLSLYAMGILGLASQCHVTVSLGVAYDLSVLLCDYSFNGRYADFCKTLCANQCATYDINDWVKDAG